MLLCVESDILWKRLGVAFRLRDTLRRILAREREAGETAVADLEETRRQLHHVTARLRQLEEEREQMALGWAPPPSVVNAPAAAACPVCTDHYQAFVPGREARIMACGHSACGECLDSWNKQPARSNGPLHCPTCRFSSDVYTVEALPRNFALMQ
ncbi:hypothetical protein CAEBREN_01641 [Caenorhabditis brenneri]|uniref:RING-type domain-containing protein n=1 Tax=Caenorhabditis brenneri TaxID=135651 RepID=G0PCZ2_CAEBE|nr:hypothetical protein CAEBREN_01641 [Caenorhabditis brenneri]